MKPSLLCEEVRPVRPLAIAASIGKPISPQLGSLKLLQFTQMLVTTAVESLRPDDMLAMGCLIVAAWCPADCKGGACFKQFGSVSLRKSESWIWGFCRVCWGCVATAAGSSRAPMAPHAMPRHDAPHLRHHYRCPGASITLFIIHYYQYSNHF